jgi:hypothetical protein
LPLQADCLKQKKSAIMPKRKALHGDAFWPVYPFPFMANVHCAAATQNVVALAEHQFSRSSLLEDFAKTKDGKPLFEKGFAHVPDRRD